METNNNNTVNVMPRIGDKAPAFVAKSTQGEINFPSDYKGMWKILFSHPADFTPVCTSETHRPHLLPSWREFSSELQRTAGW